MTRLVAVLGYSRRRDRELHPICAARLRTAEAAAVDADAVLLSGWSRRRERPAEAELMRDAWSGPEVRLLADADARTTPGNARAVAAAARELGADEVVAVTSSWHAPRARLLLRRELGPGIRLEVLTPARTRPPYLLGRELVCFAANALSRARPRRSA